MTLMQGRPVAAGQEGHLAEPRAVEHAARRGARRHRGGGGAGGRGQGGAVQVDSIKARVESAFGFSA